MNYESKLLERARAGDTAAGEEIYSVYLKESPPIQGLIRRAFAHDNDREDILHEIYLQLVTGKNIFRGEAAFSTYVYQVARMTIFQKYRRRNTLKRGKVYRFISDPIELADGIKSNPEYAYERKEARELISECIRKLPEVYREAMELRVLQDHSYEEIAGILKVPVNTVSTRIHKGKQLLADLLQGKGLEEVFSR